METASRPPDGWVGTFQHIDDQVICFSGSEEPTITITIALENIVAVFPATARSADEHSILYTVSGSTETTAPKDIPFSFNDIKVIGLSSAFVQRFKPTEQSFWSIRPPHASNPKHAHVIVSTGSGTGLASTFWARLVKDLLLFNSIRKDEHYTFHSTESEASVTELTQSIFLLQANDGVAQSILLLSGDGGIVDMAEALLSKEHSASYTKPTITLLPLGTGNAMANSSGITGDTTLGLRAMFRGSPREIPLFRANFSPGARHLVNEGKEERALQSNVDGVPVAYGAVVCSWGLHAALVADSDTAEYRKFGDQRFSKAANEALFPSDGSSPHAYRGRVTFEQCGKAFTLSLTDVEHGYVLATLVSKLQAGFTISPRSKLLDGKLRLIHFGPLSGQEAADIMGKAFQGGKHIDVDVVGYEEIDLLKIQFDEDDGRWRRVCIDGKIVRVEKGGWVHVTTQGVRGVIDLISKDD